MKESPEHEPKHAAPRITVDHLRLQSDDPEILALWEQGLARWNDAFAAFTRLGSPSLRTTDVLTDFQNLFISRYDSIDECVEEVLEDFDWPMKLDTFIHENGIDENMLVWNYDAIEKRIRDMYEVVEYENRIYLFAL